MRAADPRKTWFNGVMRAGKRTVACLVIGLSGCNGAGETDTSGSTSTSTTSTSTTSTPTTGTVPTTSAGTSATTGLLDTGEPTTTTGESTTTTTTTTGEPTTDDTAIDSDSDSGEPPLTESPWGIASSASSGYNLEGWAAQIASTGVDWLRGIENKNAEARLTTAEANGWKVAGILYYSKQQPASFPVDDLPGWQAYITDLLTRTLGRVHHWEVWNEPPNFSADKTPESYGAIVQAAYATAKGIDPTVQIGLAGQSNNVNFLDRAILAGAASNYDYVTLHPYEILDLVDDGWEAEYMSIVPTMRKMLAARDPSRAAAPIWFTEIGEPVNDTHTPEHQAYTLVKAYTMAIAQGVTRVHWFEGKDGDSGPFGLISGGGELRPSHTAMTTLVTRLGQLPQYAGWVLLEGQHYGFVFTPPEGAVMVAWSRPEAPTQVKFAAPVEVVEPTTGAVTQTSEHTLSTPVIFAGIADALVAEAKQNRKQPFPWDGDYTDATSIVWNAADGAAGLHPLGKGELVTIDGGPARNAGVGAALSFTVDPNFLSYTSEKIEITAVLRRNGAGAAGFNLKYEAVDGWHSTGQWYGVPGSDQWYTKTWTIDDSQFVGKWGFNFSFDSDSKMNSQYSVQSVLVTKL